MTATNEPSELGGAGAASLATGVTRSPEATRAVGRALAVLSQPGDVVVLAGDLGAGKTTLAQGFATGLGVTDPVTSPTFALMRQYRCALAPVQALLHLDLYRLDRLAEVADLGVAQLVEEDAVALVEWGDVATSVLGDDLLTVWLRPGAEPGERIVELWTRGERWDGRAGELRAALRAGASRP
ncbi:MAG: tRNA (adenosine(37)-N6)-threonylcarbamoyltransferase complex ATPase subunit type 1 TsaE [Actinomycetota bacterium]|nr:tRNA (adenosine(37)-N6)-threonylcarbamoyltransferase complex ATPase subunit type 1 TsaE [Actinomycetota bacterium]